MIWREKQILREKMKAAVRNAAGKALASQLIRRHLENSAIWEGAQVVFGFIALPGEPDWLGDYSPGNKLIAFPQDRRARHALLPLWHGVRSRSLGGKTAIGGAVAPSPDLVIVPGLAFDSRGARLGRGRGFYDRWLNENPAVKALGVCFKCQIVESVPTEPHDARVHAILTEEGFILP